MKKSILLLASTALLLTTNTFAQCRKDTVNQFNVSNAGVKTSAARWISTFDSKGNQLTELYQFYSSNTFENSKLITKTYNANDKVLSSLEQTYDAGNSQWVNNKKFELSYTGNNVADSAYFTWSAGSSSWQEDVRLTYTYNGQGKILSSLFKELTVNKSKREFTYDANGNETKNEFFSWSSGAWVPINKEEKTYNAGNNMLTFSIFNYNQGTMTYDKGSQYGYTYDANGNETLKETRNWDGSQYVASLRNGKTWSTNKLTQTTVQFNNAGWVTAERDDYVYNAQNLLSQMIRYRLQGGPPTLQIDSRLNYTYNTAGQLTGKANQTYNAQTSQYTTTADEIRNYSASGKLTRLFYANFSQGVGAMIPTQEYLYEFNANDDLIATETKNGFNINNSQWNSIVRQEFICGVNQVSSIAELNNIQFSLYPNPALNEFLLETDAIDAMVIITDLVGKVVFEKQLEGDKMIISVADFNTGLYIVKIQSKSENASRKLIVGK